ncbi:MAG TPA: PIN domain-containing protein [Geobacteraceae bacterium]
MPLVLIDTNVIVYACDPGEPDKRERAAQVLRFLEQTGVGRLSVQGLSEFVSVTTRRLRPSLTATEAAQQVERLMSAFPVFDLTPMIVAEALRGMRDHQLSFYDAQVWAAARLNQTPIIFSEDFNSGAMLDGVRFINPFAPDFVLEKWG